MSISKFISLITTNRLFLCRVDKFKDKLEGTLPAINLKNRLLIYANVLEHIESQPDSENARKILFENIDIATQNMRTGTYVNCWHMNRYESAAMWDLYRDGQHAIAVQTTYRKLIDTLPSGVFAGEVKYIDYNTTLMPENNLFFPIMHKRKSFEHEKEIRVVASRMFDVAVDLVKDGVTYGAEGATVEFDINSTVDLIYVSPEAPLWLCEAVESVCRSAGITTMIKQSDLYGPDVN
jgi:hypothetical protein